MHLGIGFADGLSSAYRCLQEPTLLASTEAGPQPSLEHPTRAGRSSTSNLDIIDCDLHLHAGLDGDGGDLLHHVRRRVQVDQALVDPARAQQLPRQKAVVRYRGAVPVVYAAPMVR